MNRTFRHVKGFGDGTKYVEYSEEGGYAIDKTGYRGSIPFTLEDAENFVKNGEWVETTGKETDHIGTTNNDPVVITKSEPIEISDEVIIKWAKRNNIDATLDDLRTMVEDARSLHLV